MMALPVDESSENNNNNTNTNKNKNNNNNSSNKNKNTKLPPLKREISAKALDILKNDYNTLERIKNKKKGKLIVNIIFGNNSVTTSELPTRLKAKGFKVVVVVELLFLSSFLL